MSLHLEFEPHSWYMGFAIRDDRPTTAGDPWSAYTVDGMHYSIVSFTAPTLEELRKQVKQYRTNETARIKRLYATGE